MMNQGLASVTDTSATRRQTVPAPVNREVLIGARPQKERNTVCPNRFGSSQGAVEVIKLIVLSFVIRETAVVEGHCVRGD